MHGERTSSDAFLLFGRIARKHRFVLPEDLQECLGIQERLELMGGRMRLGEVLSDQGYMGVEHVVWILGRQRLDAPCTPEKSLFGDLAVRNGFIPPAAVARALKRARRGTGRDGMRIGEVLVAQGEMAARERDAILLLQRRLREGAVLDAGMEREPKRFLLLEEGPVRRSRIRRIAAAAVLGILLAVLAAIVAFAVFQ